MNDDHRSVPLNRGGRPRLVKDAESVTVSTRLPEPIHEKLQAIAVRRDKSLSAVMRELVILNVD
jgi:hypothetical protein